MTDDVEALVASMEKRGIEATPISEQSWGKLTKVNLPGGGKLGIYQPLHESPPTHAPRAVSKRRAPARRKRGTARKTRRGPWARGRRALPDGER
jgi:hypothetical protein